MKWYEKFRVGQKVRVVKKVAAWKLPGGGTTWNSRFMDRSVGRVYKIVEIHKGTGYRLETRKELNYAFWYPVESLEEINVKGKQLLFNFMNEE